jgi:hypothetical protein
MERSLTPDAEELENERSQLAAYTVGAIPGFVIGAVAGFYGSDRLNDYVDVLREAPIIVRGLIDAVGIYAGGVAGNCAFGFSAVGIHSALRKRRKN